MCSNNSKETVTPVTIPIFNNSIKHIEKGVNNLASLTQNMPQQTADIIRESMQANLINYCLPISSPPISQPLNPHHDWAGKDENNIAKT
jgi:hypothetical protein